MGSSGDLNFRTEDTPSFALNANLLLDWSITYVFLCVFQPQQIQPPPRESGTDSGDSPPGTERSSSKETEDEDEDFFAKQAKLQAEARLALAQVRYRPGGGGGVRGGGGTGGTSFLFFPWW